jgi:hypothetical protein
LPSQYRRQGTFAQAKPLRIVVRGGVEPPTFR